MPKLPNVIYNSHIAGGSNTRLDKQAVDDIAAYLKGGPPLIAITTEMLDRIE